MFLFYQLDGTAVGKGKLSKPLNEIPQRGIWKKTASVIKGKHTLTTRNNAAVVRPTLCNYDLNEEKGLQE